MQPIEVQARPNAFLGMEPAVFLERYWQKQPLLVRGALAGYTCPLQGDDLAGLACEPLAASRLVRHDRTRDEWLLRQGPFAETDFANLPERDWTLLVQDCDKLLGEVEPLLQRFRFVPSWRIDDVMISYAAPGGSVGPHIDQYDVFLLQAQGQRRWQISTDPHADATFRPEGALKILRAFTPTHDWVLQPGDLLYLPPGVPHYGTALDDCLTFSVGMRAPSAAELLLDFAEHRADRLPEEQRYQDPDLEQQRHPAELTEAAVRRVRRQLEAALRCEPRVLRDWLASFVTRYRSAHEAAPAESSVAAPALRQAVSAGAALYRNPWSRYAFTRVRGGARAWFAGQGLPCSLPLAVLMQDHQRLDWELLEGRPAKDWEALAQWVNAGHWVLDHEPISSQ